ncbi:MAG: ribulose 1,5-bisphosphate carboxylase large subunit [Spirochaetales bacterium]|nr:ribulose 1,5-bisphosphate carboxylase large subunit [Spirochaetales bacterium]
MERSPKVVLSNKRFAVTYSLEGTKQQCLLKARHICFEQTVEFPEDLIPAGDIKNHIIGRIEDFQKTGQNRFQAEISFAVETAGAEFTQLLNVIFGNSSLKPGIKVEKTGLPAKILDLFTGPRFGQSGLRKIVRAPKRPLICTALKPMGLSAAQLAEQAYRFALGGIDIIKDDHGLADQPFCSFEERAARCAEAVKKANRKTGGHSVYMPNITASADRVLERAHYAKENGAGALLIAPGLTGPDTLRILTQEQKIDLPVISHPAFWGSFVTSSQSGLSHYFLYGQLSRLAGADAVIYPHSGGRFAFSKQECMDIARGCNDKLGKLKKIFPMPGGGMTEDKLSEMFGMYGRDFILLIGGELHRHGADLTKNSRRLLEMLEKV